MGRGVGLLHPFLDDSATREYLNARAGATDSKGDLQMPQHPGFGDDINVVVTSPAYPAQVNSDGVVKPGYEHVVRVVGWEINLDDRTLIHGGGRPERARDDRPVEGDRDTLR